MVDDVFYICLYSVWIYFIEDFYICVHQEYWPVVFFSIFLCLFLYLEWYWLHRGSLGAYAWIWFGCLFVLLLLLLLFLLKKYCSQTLSEHLVKSTVNSSGPGHFYPEAISSLSTSSSVTALFRLLISSWLDFGSLNEHRNSSTSCVFSNSMEYGFLVYPLIEICISLVNCCNVSLFISASANSWPLFLSVGWLGQGSVNLVYFLKAPALRVIDSL